MDDTKLQRLIDRQDILDCLNRYSRGIDRYDRELLISAYHPDAKDDHGAFVGTREDFADWVFVAHSGQLKTMHFLGNHTCELEGDVAHTETYCIYFGYNKDETIDVVGNRYNDRMEKRNGEWRIADRICVLEWLGALKAGPEVESVLKTLIVQLGENAVTSRDKRDVSYIRPLKVVREKSMAVPHQNNAG